MELLKNIFKLTVEKEDQIAKIQQIYEKKPVQIKKGRKWLKHQSVCSTFSGFK